MEMRKSQQQYLAGESRYTAAVISTMQIKAMVAAHDNCFQPS